MRSHIVYMYTCASCNASYIGQTTPRHLRQRISEHRRVSHLTGKVMKSQVHSSIKDHILNCPNSDCQHKQFKILAKGSNDFELLIKERLLINQYTPSLNANIGSFELLLTWTNIHKYSIIILIHNLSLNNIYLYTTISIY